MTQTSPASALRSTTSAALAMCFFSSLVACSSGGNADGAGGTSGSAKGGTSGGGQASQGGTRASSGGASASSAGANQSNGGAAQGGSFTGRGGNSNPDGGSSAGGGTEGGNDGGASGNAKGGTAGATSSKGGSTANGGNTSSSAGGTAASAGAGGSAQGGKAAGGALGSGGSAAGGSAGAATGGAGDRCDVGVYDSAKPPQVLALSGALGIHDPSAFIEADGTYYLFQTGLGAKTSANMTNWKDVAKPFAAPTWAQTQVPGVTDLWAPDVSYFGGQYHLYYSASTFGKNRSCIGQATRASLSAGSWADQGQVICSNVDTTDNWNAIDPSVIIDTSNNPWLVFGSFWSGIKIIPLTQTGARSGTTLTAIANRPNNGGALEAPFIVRRCGYYYLFTSWDTCCKGADSTYNIRVGRSTSVTGPYTDKAGTALSSGGGTLIAQSSSTWAGPGGQSVTIAGTKAYLVYHAYAMSNGASSLHIADLVWDSSGWPVPVGP